MDLERSDDLVVERLKGFHPTILVNDPFADEDKIREEGCEPVTKEELLKRSDVVTIHARINAGDPPIIGKEEFGQMKETAYLINTARAVAVDMKELYHALSEHKIMGAAIDVFPTEPVTKDEPLLKCRQYYSDKSSGRSNRRILCEST